MADAPRNCMNCPGYNPAGKPITGVGTPLIPVCETRGMVLTTRNMSPERQKSVLREVAQNCDKFGQNPPSATIPISISTVVTGLKRTDSDVQPRSCNACARYMRPETMERAIGVPHGACSVYGQLILPGTATAVAKRCPVGLRYLHTEQPQPETVDSLNYLPHLDANVTFIRMDGTVDEPETTVVAEDPALRPTDAPVTDDDISKGIRAWRKVEDPENPSRSVLLPIFDMAHFDDTDKAKIPRPGDDEHPELYQDHQGLAYKLAVLWLHLNETPALHGVAGTGKTEAFRYLAYLMQLPFERFSITSSTELDDLAGRWVLRSGKGGNETVFQYGRLPLAWKRPCVIVLDEPNTGPPDVWQFLRPLTDNSKQMVLDMNRGERVMRHEYALMGMAMNPAWDVRNAGVHEVADADGSRLMHIAVPYPTQELEKNILKQRCSADGYQIPFDTVTAIVKIAKELRDLSGQDGSLSITWGVRQTIKVARATRFFSLRQAHRLAAADLVDPSEAEQILAIVSAHDSGKNHLKSSTSSITFTTSSGMQRAFNPI